ncbi:MAG: hypothetical protein E6R03_02215, partial [Hyphomicrobiaceae bacterium]
MAVSRETVGLAFGIEADPSKAVKATKQLEAEVQGFAQKATNEFAKAGAAAQSFGASAESAAKETAQSRNAMDGALRDIGNGAADQLGAASGAMKDLIANASGLGLAMASTAAVGAAAIAAMVAFTLKQGEAAQKIQLTSQTLGISVEKLQLYQLAAEAAGVSSDAITDAFEKFRQQTGRNAADFDALLKSLEAVERPADKLAIVHANLGEVSEDTAMAILAMTENSGELRKAIEQSGAILSRFEAQELARVEQRFDVLTAKVSGFAKRTLLELIDAFTEMGVMIGQGGAGLDALTEKQQRAEAATRAATDAIQGQSGAVNQLSIALRNLDFSAIEKGVKDRVAVIVEQLSATAKRALTEREAKAIFENQQKLDPAFAEAVKRSSIFDANKKLFDDLLNPKEKKAPTGGGRTGTARDWELDLVREQQRAIEIESNRIAALAKKMYEERKLTVQTYERIAIEAEKNILAAQEATLTRERQLIERGTKPGAERTAKLQKVANDEAQIRARAEIAIEAITKKRIEEERRLEKEAAAERRRSAEEEMARLQEHARRLQEYLRARNELLSGLAEGRVAALDQQAADLEARARREPRLLE